GPTLSATATGATAVTSTPTATALSTAPSPTPSVLASTILPVPALVISSLTPRVGDLVTFTNRSRDAHGNGIAAQIGFGDGSVGTVIGVNVPLQHTYTTGGTFHVTLTAVDVDGNRLAVGRDIIAEPRPAT